MRQDLTPEFEIGPWRDGPRPADASELLWEMCRIGSEQNASAVRCLWDGETARAMGGVIEVGKRDGLAFVWRSDAMPLDCWRKIRPAMQVCIQQAHERGLRRISAVIDATFAMGHRLVTSLGFEFAGDGTGFAGSDGPMMMYARHRPLREEAALVRHQKRELWLAMLGAHCPAYQREALARIARGAV